MKRARTGISLCTNRRCSNDDRTGWEPKPQQHRSDFLLAPTRRADRDPVRPAKPHEGVVWKGVDLLFDHLRTGLDLGHQFRQSDCVAICDDIELAVSFHVEVVGNHGEAL